jgi:hypothetical protein
LKPLTSSIKVRSINPEINKLKELSKAQSFSHLDTHSNTSKPHPLTRTTSSDLHPKMMSSKTRATNESTSSLMSSMREFERLFHPEKQQLQQKEENSIKKTKKIVNVPIEEQVITV